jgi:response regulator RpfG family c-di-GMP phosphodiesterase
MLQDIKAYFEGLGWAANIMAFLPIFGGVIWIYRKWEAILKWFGRRKLASIKDYMTINTPNYTFNNKSVKIVVVDDNPDDFPLEYLRNTFGQVTVFDKISLSEASKLVGNDLIFLDMTGVVKEDPKYGGLQLIKKVKDLPDAPIVVAVSRARFDPTATDYFKIADDVLKKPLTEMKCEEVVLELVRDKVSPFKAADTIDSEILGKSKNDREKDKMNSLVFSFLDGKISIDALRAELLNSYRHLDTSLIVANVQRVKATYVP